MTRATLQHLQRPESLDLFLLWRALGGMNQGVTLSELLTLPAWLTTDLRYLLARLGAARRRKQRWEQVRRDTAKTGPAKPA